MKQPRVGTRGSALALWQTRHVIRLLRDADAALEPEEVIIGSEADDRAEAPVASMEQGVFVRRLERALIEGRADLAVHSLKDLPTKTPDELIIAAVPRRHDSHDALVTADGRRLDQLEPRATVGTGSARRRAQLLHARPDLDVRPIRGNVDTRIRKMREGQVDALLLAVAGLERLGLDEFPAWRLPARVCLPAAGQGALAIQARRGDAELCRVLSGLTHSDSMARVTAERAFLSGIGAGCLAPTTAHATIDAGRLHVEAMVASLDGRVVLVDREAGPPDHASAIGARLAERLALAGGRRLLAAARGT